MKMLRDQLFWLIALFVALIFWLPYSQPLFAALFPQLPRPVYQQESFAALALAHFWLVGISSLFAVIIGTCLLYTSPSPRDRTRSRMPSSA